MLLSELKREFIFDCQVREMSERTVQLYTRGLSYFLSFLEKECEVLSVEQLKPIHIKAYINFYQKKKRKPAYINDLLKVVKCMCAYAYREGYTPALITENVRNVKEPKVLIHTFSESEVMDIVQYWKGMDYLSIRNRVILMILFDTGIRISELTGMRISQVCDTYFVIHGKGNKERMVPRNPIVAKWLMKYIVVRNGYFQDEMIPDYIFLSKTGKQLTNEAIAKVLKRTAKAVGVNPLVRVSPHTCRHTFAQLQIKNGLDLYSLSRLLGHESVAITQRYLESIQVSEILTLAKRTSVLTNLLK